MTRAVTRAVLVLLALLLPGAAGAHGTGYRVAGAGGVVVDLYYADGEPMAYADARVFSPADPAVAFVHGRADRLGRVAFVPDRDGPWRVEATDGQGHFVHAAVPVAPGDAAAAGGAPGGWSWPLWASLTANLFVLATFLARRPARPRLVPVTGAHP